MTPEGIAALLVSLSTFLGGLVLAYRGLSGDKFQRRVSESAALLSGYTEMVTNLRKEIEAIRSQHAAEVDRQFRQHHNELQGLRALHAEERARWNTERIRLEERIETLEAQVTALLMRPVTARTRSDDDEYYNPTEGMLPYEPDQRGGGPSHP